MKYFIVLLLSASPLLGSETDIHEMLYPLVHVVHKNSISGGGSIINTIDNQDYIEFNVLTAAHVIMDGEKIPKSISVHLPHWNENGEKIGYTSVKCFVVKCNKEYDFAIIKGRVTKTNVVNKLKPVNICKNELKLFDSITAVGATLGQDVWITQGTIACLNPKIKDMSGKVIGISAEGLYGSSGCPIYNQNRELIGITRGGLVGPAGYVPHMHLIVPINVIMDMLEE